jgi:hypothetical protein
MQLDAAGFFASFTAPQARALADSFAVDFLTAEKLTEITLMAVYGATLEGDGNARFDIPEPDEDTEKTLVGAEYDAIFRKTEKELVRRGFKPLIFEFTVEVSWKLPARNQEYRFVEMLPDAITARSMFELGASTNVRFLQAAGIFHYCLVMIMHEAQLGGSSFGFDLDFLAYDRDADQSCDANHAGVSFRSMLHDVALRLSKRGFGVRFPDQPWDISIKW